MAPTENYYGEPISSCTFYGYHTHERIEGGRRIVSDHMMSMSLDFPADKPKKKTTFARAKNPMVREDKKLQRGF